MANRRGLKGREAVEGALAEYERLRNEASADEHRENLGAGFEQLPPPVFRIREAAKADPAEVTRFAMARFGMIDPREFFNPQNLERLLGPPGSAHDAAPSGSGSPRVRGSLRRASRLARDDW